MNPSILKKPLPDPNANRMIEIREKKRMGGGGSPFFNFARLNPFETIRVEVQHFNHFLRVLPLVSAF